MAPSVSDLPPVSLFIVALCVSLHCLLFVIDVDLRTVTFCPRNVIYLLELYRMVTGSLFHANLMHIGMNMMSTVAIGTTLERHFGTLHLSFTILWSILLTSVVYLSAAVLLSLIGRDSLMFQHSVGFSGVLFHLAVLESNIGSPTRSVFGFFSVPAMIYPIVLLVALQMFMPNLSFMGHLSGVIAGFLQVYGALDFLLVDESFLKEMEDWPIVRRSLIPLPNFVMTTQNVSLMRRDPSSLRSTICGGLGRLKTYTCHMLGCIKVAIFGRGRGSNANIQLWGPSSVEFGGLVASPLSPVEPVEDDEDWSGLPPHPGESSMV
jgi:membrane associated rhomboid family serine protease